MQEQQIHYLKTFLKNSHWEMTTSTGKEKNKKKSYICIRCGFDMIEMSACHLKCYKCGAEHDCFR